MNGKIVSHYEIAEKLGAGGMGVVYKARDLRLERFAALKFLAAHLLDSAAAKTRFLQEARVISRLAHPNIAVLYEVGEYEGDPFLAFEYLPGGTLRALLIAERENGRRLPLEDAVGFAVQIAEGLAHAHRNGVIHRDIKPGNLMFNAEGALKITDFGLSRLVAAPHITATDARLGTAAYMSPEQARGEEADHRSDIYSAGAVIYEMLAGEPLAGRELRPLQEARPGAPASLNRILERALRKDRGQRYAATDELVRDLRGVQRELEQPTATGSRSHFRTAGGRRPWTRRALFAVALAALVALAAALALRSRPPQPAFAGPKHIAVLPFENIGADPANEAFCEGLVETLTTSLTELEQFHGSLRVVPASEVRKQSIRSAGDARRAFNVNLVITGSVQRTGGQIRLTANLVDAGALSQIGARSIVRRVQELNTLQDSVVREVARLLDVSLQSKARQLLAAGSTSSAGAYDLYLQAVGYLERYDKPGNLDEAARLLQRALAQDDRYALAYAGLSRARWQRYSISREPALLEQALELGLRACSLEANVPATHENLGRIYASMGRDDAAVKEYGAALNLDPLSVEAHRGLAGVYESSRRPRDAERVYKQAMDLRPNDWLTCTLLGTFYYKQSRYAEAEPLFRKVVELTPDNYLAYYNLGALHNVMGRSDAAVEEFRKSIALRENRGGYMGLSVLYFNEGRYRDAALMNEKAVQLSDGASYTLLGNLANAYRWTPEFADKAADTYRRAIQTANRALAVNPTDAFALSCRALYEAKLNQPREALRDIEAARSLAPADLGILVKWALVEELGHHREAALKGLGMALAGGYSPEEIDHDPELAALRNDTRFAKLTAKTKTGGH